MLILADEALPVGCLLTVRMLGVMEAEQTEEGTTVRNDRLVAKVAQSHTYADVCDVEQLGDAFLKELTRFFITYNELKGKQFRVVAVGDPQRAATLVGRGSARQQASLANE